MTNGYQVIVARILDGPNLGGLRKSLIPAQTGKNKGQTKIVLFELGGYSDFDALESGINERRFGTDRDGCVWLAVKIRFLEMRSGGGWTFGGVAEVSDGGRNAVCLAAQERFSQFGHGKLFVSGVFNTGPRNGFMNVGVAPMEHIEGGKY